MILSPPGDTSEISCDKINVNFCTLCVRQNAAYKYDFFNGEIHNIL